MPVASKSPEAVLDTLKLTPAEWLEYVERLDQAEAGEQQEKPAQVALRRHSRRAYLELAQLGLVVHYDSKRRASFLVRTHDLSESGLGFLHGGFLHPGTRVHLLMLHRASGRKLVQGTVRRCIHVDRHIHKVGIEFDQPIVVSDHLLSTVDPEAQSLTPQRKFNIDLSAIENL